MSGFVCERCGRKEVWVTFKCDRCGRYVCNNCINTKGILTFGGNKEQLCLNCVYPKEGERVNDPEPEPVPA